MNMTFCIGIMLGVLTALCKAGDTIINKDIMGEISPIEHSLYRIVFVLPVLGIASIFNWHLEKDALGLLFVYGILEVINILFHQMAVKELKPIYAELISKSKTITTYIVSLIMMIESVSLGGVLGVIIFMVGIIITIDFSSLGSEKYANKKGIFCEIVSVLIRTAKPFVLRQMLLSESISNETLAFLSMPIAFVFIYIIFRPKLNFRKLNVKKYSLQAVIVGISMITSGYAIIMASTVLTAMTENLSIFAVAIMSFFLYKKRNGFRFWIGAVLAVIGLVMVSI